MYPLSAISISPLLAIFSDWSLLLLRLVLGAIFLYHGWPKIRNLKATAESFKTMGFRPGFFWGAIVALAEFFGGVLFIAGFYVQFAAAILAIQFLVIIFWKLVKRMPFGGGLELDLLIFVSTLVLMTLGGGFYSFSW